MCIDYGQEHHLIWVVALDATGEIWAVPNPEVRVQNNWTMGRSVKPAETVQSSAQAAPPPEPPKEEVSK